MTALIPSFGLVAAAVFGLTLLMNLGRDNASLVVYYLLQSLIVSLGLAALSFAEGAQGLLYAAFLTLAVKAILAPAFLFRLIKRYRIYFAAASYLNVPFTLLCLALITAFSYSLIGAHIPEFGRAAGVALLFASILCVLFMMVNRRGTLASILGILSLENGVVLLSAQLGLAHSFALEFAVSFDIAIWIAIATGFLSMIYREFGTVDTAARMTRLTEE